MAIIITRLSDASLRPLHLSSSPSQAEPKPSSSQSREPQMLSYRLKRTCASQVRNKQRLSQLARSEHPYHCPHHAD
ncbi:unnamed protein product, partial [Caenorhabditis auriculariae]